MVTVTSVGQVQEAVDGRNYRTVTLANINETKTVVVNGMPRQVKSVARLATTTVVAWEENKVLDNGQEIPNHYDGLYNVQVGDVLEGAIVPFSIEAIEVENENGTTIVTERNLFVPVEKNTDEWTSIVRKTARYQGVTLTDARYASTNVFVSSKSSVTATATTTDPADPN